MAEDQIDRTLAEVDSPVTFRVRPLALPGELRPLWRLSVLLLMVSNCRGERASLPQLHVLSSALRSPVTQESFLQALSGNRQPDSFVTRFDPVLNQTVDLAVGEQLVAWDRGKRIHLLGRGRRFVTTIMATPDLLTVEKQLLNRLPNRLTQSEVDVLLTGLA
jgi:hypothetical protein